MEKPGAEYDWKDDEDACVWSTDTGTVLVRFEPSGGARQVGYVIHARQQQSPLENLLWRAKRQWRRWFP
jgi:hypothetical protein